MPPTFGKRPFNGFPPASPPPTPGSPSRRLRSGAVVVGAIGALTLGIAAAAEWREEKCRPRSPGDPEPRPAWCDSGGRSHSGGHGWGLFSSHGGSSGIGHASFGGFGAHGAGHGGGA